MRSVPRQAATGNHASFWDSTLVARGERLDERLVREALVENRSRAQALILAGQVLVDDTPVDKPGTRIREDAVVRVRGGRRFVSRGGEKLAGALEDLGVEPKGLACLDIGASTGGFTDCLLQRGAASVLAVDVGYGQLEGGLRNDARVTLLERTNARNLEPAQVPAGIGLVTVDVSFIASRLVLPALARVAPEAEWLVMVKPQFEVGRSQVGKGGVVRDPELRRAAADDVAEAAAALGWLERGRADSRLPGPKGNVEIFLRLCGEGAEETGEGLGVR
jgi:23S rRNA (cytidine1920-2'-O)/16S rRNA (cytidine1409-2'-O)-methyltransferase